MKRPRQLGQRLTTARSFQQPRLRWMDLSHRRPLMLAVEAEAARVVEEAAAEAAEVQRAHVTTA